MLREVGHTVRLYDPLFFPDAAPLAARHDFITCTEVAEHFHRPGKEFERLAAMLRPGGWLAVMTCFQTDDARFEQWHYRKDPTHVVFYRDPSLHRGAAWLEMRDSGQERGLDAQDEGRARAIMASFLHQQRIDAVVDTIRDNGVETVRDLGCGDGAALLQMARLSAIRRFVGVDVSVAALESVRARLEDCVPCDGVRVAGHRYVAAVGHGLLSGKCRHFGFLVFTLA
jgi:cyclopropane fatty-acyl-phospholipid synthase-like methyltransferase